MVEEQQVQPQRNLARFLKSLVHFTDADWHAILGESRPAAFLEEARRQVSFAIATHPQRDVAPLDLESEAHEQIRRVLMAAELEARLGGPDLVDRAEVLARDAASALILLGLPLSPEEQHQGCYGAAALLYSPFDSVVPITRL